MKVLLADDHAIVREGLKHIIQNITTVAVIIEVSNGRDALRTKVLI